MSETKKEFYEKMLQTNICEIAYNFLGAEFVIQATQIGWFDANDFICNPDEIRFCNVTIGGKLQTLKLFNVKSFKILDKVLPALDGTPLNSKLFTNPNARKSATIPDFLQNVQSTIPTEVSKLYFDTAIKSPRDHYLDLLRNNVCNIEFTKADGSHRKMRCTLMYDTMQSLNLIPYGNKPKSVTEDLDVMKVIDLDIQEWRAFKISTLISFAAEMPQSPQQINVQINIPTQKIITKGSVRREYV